jgi:AraC family transcriptional regulator
VTLDANHISEAIGRRFHRSQAPTLIAHVRPARHPIIVSHVVSDTPSPEKTLAPPVEAAFAIHVHHRPLKLGETWIDGKYAEMPSIAPGGICIFDLRGSPVASIREPLDFTRFGISRTTLDDLAYERGQPSVSELRIPELGHPDPVIHSLALALISRQNMFGHERDSLFADWVALAFHAHLVDAYTETRAAKPGRWAIPPWKLRSACEWMMERLDDPLSIEDVAAQVDMTAGYFARAFRQATGEPPHRWLMRRRIERAKELLRLPGLTLAEIASACGFVDQSHLTRVFGRTEGTTPGQWRQRLRD